VSSLRHSPSLRELDISNTEVTAAGTTGLDEIGTLQCLKAGGRTQLDASTLRRCRSLREVDLSASGCDGRRPGRAGRREHAGNLKLSFCLEVRDVSALARSVSLRKLHLGGSAVCDAGIAGLERIPSLTSLSLASCESITNVTNLFRSKSLRRLDVSNRPSRTLGSWAWNWRLRWNSSSICTSRELPDVASRGDFKHQPVVPSDVGVDDETAVRILDAIETDEDEVRIALLGKCAVIR
jgi:hypothetical protein